MVRRSSSDTAELEQMRPSKYTEQSDSKTWTAGIDVLRSYYYQDTQWHLHAIEFHHKVKDEASGWLRYLAVLPKYHHERHAKRKSLDWPQ